MSRSKTDKERLLKENINSRSKTDKERLLKDNVNSASKSSSSVKIVAIVVIILLILGGAVLALYFLEIYPFSSSDVERVDTDDIQALRAIMFDFFEDTTNEFGDRQPKIATLVRLTFHDCIGPPAELDQEDINNPYFDRNRYPFDAQSLCDGGIDFSSPDHSNLEKDIIEPLEEIYRSGFNKIMSRADFWMTAGILALEKGALNQFTGNAQFFGPKAFLPDLPFVFGRVDCPTSPNCSEGGFELPKPTFLWDDTQEFFLKEFNFTDRETVTILGAHTFGRAHQNNSGFKNRWVGQEHVLNHAFYVALLESHQNPQGWSQIIVNRTGNLQWSNSLGAGPPLNTNGSQGIIGNRLMFNSDLSLKSRLADNVIDEEGRVNCTVSPFINTTIQLCPEQTDIIDIVREFGERPGRGNGESGNLIWVNEFREVFEKMILMGYQNINENDDFYFVDGGRDTTGPTSSPTSTPIEER